MSYPAKKYPEKPQLSIIEGGEDKNNTNKNIDFYLDKNGEPVGKKKKRSHIYPNC